MLRYDRQLDLV